METTDSRELVTCKRCGRRLPEEHFPTDPLLSGGLSDACLDCQYDEKAHLLRLERKARRYLRIGDESAVEKAWMLRHAAALLSSGGEGGRRERSLFSG